LGVARVVLDVWGSHHLEHSRRQTRT
jgi:hypothetical protein